MMNRFKAAIGSEICQQEYDAWNASTVAKGRLNKSSSSKRRAEATALEPRLRMGLLAKLPIVHQVGCHIGHTSEVVEHVAERVTEQTSMIGYPNKGTLKRHGWGQHIFPF